jgi:hypothetical protein
MQRKYTPCLAALCIFLLVLSPVRSDETEPETETQSPLQSFRDQLKSKVSFCTPGLANAYGLNGLATPIELSKEGWMFCPNMKSVCCSNDDGDSAYATIQGGLKRLKQIFSSYTGTIKEYIEQLTISRSIASRVNNRLAKIKFSNCKVLASKIILYDINKVGVQVIEALNAAYKFMLLNYKGFYCEICDAKKNKFVFDADGFVVLHKNQCRETVVGSIKAMYYLRVLFVNLSNLAVKFMNNCDAKGTFFDDALMSQLLLNNSPEDRLVERCWNERNSPKWLEECKEFCEKFNFVSLEDYFKPYAYKYALITAFLKKRTLQMVSQETLDSSIDQPAQTGSIGLLDDMETSQAPPLKFLGGFNEHDFQEADQKAQMLIKSMGGNSIITSIVGSGTAIDSNTYVFMERGFDFVTSGKATMISTTDDQIDPQGTMVPKESFDVKRTDSKGGYETGTGGNSNAGNLPSRTPNPGRELINQDDGVDGLEHEAINTPHEEVGGPKAPKHRQAKHAHPRSLHTASIMGSFVAISTAFFLISSN